MRFITNIFLLSILLATPGFMEAQGPYKLQLTVFDQPVPLEYFGDLEGITIAQDQNDFYRVYQGEFTTEAEARTAQAAAEAKGYQYATVIDIGAMNKYCTAACRPNLYVENIFFDFDRYDLRAESRKDLSDLAILMIENAAYDVLLTAHTDSKGTSDYNRILSENRAESAKNYLIVQGIEEDRIHIDYKGESNPIARNESESGSDSPAGRQFNRRVEVSLLGTDGSVIPNVVKDIEVPENLKF